MAEIDLILALYLGSALVLILSVFIILAFFDQRAVDKERQIKYNVEFSNGRYVLVKKRPLKRLKY